MNEEVARYCKADVNLKSEQESILEEQEKERLQIKILQQQLKIRNKEEIKSRKPLNDIIIMRSLQELELLKDKAKLDQSIKELDLLNKEVIAQESDKKATDVSGTST